jgi:NTP pyrophosphatase (non-canonical NTP hydrolase)
MQNLIFSGEMLKEQILKFHGQSVKNGFYDDYPTQESRQTEEYICSRSMLIAGELYEAYEAYRSGKIDTESTTLDVLMLTANKQGLTAFAAEYKKYAKGTVAEELADTYIRICDAAGAAEIYHAPDLVEELANLKEEAKKSGIHALFYTAASGVGIGNYKPIHSGEISYSLACVYLLADYLKIDLHRHVELKHLYNTTRSYKHGKDF